LEREALDDENSAIRETCKALTEENAVAKEKCKEMV
jgi:hypothetical protein